MLNIKDISKTFNPGTPDEVQAIKHVSLAVPDGAFVVVIGTNGSGKSTLQQLIAGACVPDSGSIELAGEDITRWGEHRRAALIGRVFQNPFSGTAPTLSIIENMALAARRGQRRGLGWLLSGAVRRRLRDRVAELGMGLEDRLDNAIGSLSGGQRQALTLLMAVLQRPSLLLLDEHTAALDPKASDQVIRLTRDMVAREKLTTVMVTHSMHQAAHLGDRLIMMVNGEIRQDLAAERKRRVNVEDLLALFEQVRRADRLDASAAELLRGRYV